MVLSAALHSFRKGTRTIWVQPGFYRCEIKVAPGSGKALQQLFEYKRMYKGGIVWLKYNPYMFMSPLI